MSKSARKWLIEIEDWMGWNVSKSFIERLDNQLKAEFEYLTGKIFDGKHFHFHLKPGDQLTYVEDTEIPYGTISGTLMFIDFSVPTRFVWIDFSTRRLYKIDDDISQSQVEFHWIDFPTEDWAVKQIKDSVVMDWREKFGLKAEFPIITIADSIGTDISFIVKSKDRIDISRIDELLVLAQKNWNNLSIGLEKTDPAYKGIVHSVGLSYENDEGKAVFSIDTGSAGEKAVLSMINELIKSEIPIVELEIESG